MSIAIRTGADTVVRAVPTRRQQFQGAIENGLLRPGPDDTYADCDDATWMSIDWPAMTRRLVIEGREVNVVDSGGSDKPVMLFVHGLSGTWQNWLLNIPAFLDTHRVIAPDLPGFGESPMPREKISIQGYARILDELLDALGVDSAVVVGNSMGGFVAAELALSFSTRVERLVLVSAAGTRGFVPAMEALVSYGFRDRLSRIEVPTLVVWGRNDMLVPRGDARDYVRLIGDNARREMFEDTGHLTMVERPSRFNRMLAAFVAGEREPESDVEAGSARGDSSGFGGGGMSAGGARAPAARRAPPHSAGDGALGRAGDELGVLG